jgi:hypothetical protein
MQTTRLICCGLMLAAAAPLCANASPLGTKPGAWETTVTSTISGLPQAQAPQIPKDQLEKMPPERRAMIEKMMAMREGKPVTSKVKSCIKDSDSVDKLTAEDRPNCKKKIISQTSTSLEMDITCSGQRASHMHVKMRALSAREVVATTDADGEEGFKMHADSKSRWVGSSCAGIEAQ